MTAWTSDELSEIGAAEEVQNSATTGDSTLRNPVRKIGSARLSRQWLWLSREVMSGYGEISPLTRKEQRSIWAIMLAVQILFTEHFLDHGNRAEADVNLNAFFWLAGHRKEICELL